MIQESAIVLQRSEIKTLHVKESVFEPQASLWTITEADGLAENSGYILRVNGLM